MTQPDRHYSMDWDLEDQKIERDREAQRRAGTFYKSSFMPLAMGVGISGLLLSGCSAPTQPPAPEGLTSPIEIPTLTEESSQATPSKESTQTVKAAKGFSTKQTICQTADRVQVELGSDWKGNRLDRCIKKIGSRQDDGLFYVKDTQQGEAYAGVEVIGNRTTQVKVVYRSRMEKDTQAVPLGKEYQIFCTKTPFSCDLQTKNQSTPFPLQSPIGTPLSPSLTVEALTSTPSPGSTAINESTATSSGATSCISWNHESGKAIYNGCVAETSPPTRLTASTGIPEEPPDRFDFSAYTGALPGATLTCVAGLTGFFLSGLIVSRNFRRGVVHWIGNRIHSFSEAFRPIEDATLDVSKIKSANPRPEEKKTSRTTVVNGKIIDAESFEPVEPEPGKYSEALYPETLKIIAGRKEDKPSKKS